MQHEEPDGGGWPGGVGGLQGGVQNDYESVFVVSSSLVADVLLFVCEKNSVEIQSLLCSCACSLVVCTYSFLTTCK